MQLLLIFIAEEFPFVARLSPKSRWSFSLNIWFKTACGGFCCGFMTWSWGAVFTFSMTLSLWLHSGRKINTAVSASCIYVCVCVCARAHVHSLCMFAHSLLLEVLVKVVNSLHSWCRLLAFLVCMCPYVCVSVWVWGESKLCHGATTASGRVKPITLASDVGAQYLFRTIKDQLSCQMMGKY